MGVNHLISEILKIWQGKDLQLLGHFWAFFAKYLPLVQGIFHALEDWLSTRIIRFLGHFFPKTSLCYMVQLVISPISGVSRAKVVCLAKFGLWSTQKFSKASKTCLAKAMIFLESLTPTLFLLEANFAS